MEGKIATSPDPLKILVVNSERELRLLDPSVRRAYLDGGALLRHDNSDKSTGGWISEEVKVGTNVHLSRTAIVLGQKSIGNNVFLGDNTTVRNSEIKDDVRMGDGVLIGDSLLLGNCRIGHGAVIDSSVLGYDVSVGDMALVARSEVRNHVQVGGGSSVKGSMMLGNNRIGEGSVITDSTVFVNLEIGERSVIAHSRIELTKARRIAPDS